MLLSLAGTIAVPITKNRGVSPHVLNPLFPLTRPILIHKLDEWVKML